MEIKSGATISAAWFAGLRRIRRTIPDISSAAIVYGGGLSQERTDATAVTLSELADFLNSLDP
ncbi:MAG: hypothetical protein KTV68_06885 [Acidimicrobiia bacterium]|nr:hypothetical protein [Acidimicrobiia bacterium]MCY4433291.1 hypothetical protein [bacterium]